MNIRTRILLLKNEHPGWGLRRIAKLVSRSHNTVKYHLHENVRMQYKFRQSRNRKIRTDALKVACGGRCFICGYEKCLEALHFHHIDQNKKQSCVMLLIRSKGVKSANEESKKCILICSNCHAEVHAKITIIPSSSPP